MLNEPICSVLHTLVQMPQTLKLCRTRAHLHDRSSFQHGVEKEMKKQPANVVLDFENVIASSNSARVNVVELQSRNILAWKAGHSLAKLKKAPNRAEMVVIQLSRGSRDMFFKLSHGEEEFTQWDYVIKKIGKGKTKSKMYWLNTEL